MREVELPPLDEVGRLLDDNARWDAEETYQEALAAIRDYARLAVLQERERCAQIVDRWVRASTNLSVLLEPAIHGENKSEKARGREMLAHIASAIRSQS